MTRLLDILDEERPDEEELVAALQDLQDLHEYNRQWATWPVHVEEVRRSAYKRGMFLLLRGILLCIEKDDGRVRAAAVDLLDALVVGGCSLTQIPAVFVVECGA